MSGKARPPVRAASIQQDLPQIEPKILGNSDFELTDATTGSIRNELTVGMGNAVAADMARDQEEEEPEESALGDLAAEMGTEKSEPTPPDDAGAGAPDAPGAPANPNEAAPEQAEAAESIANAGGGQALPADVKEEAETAFGASLSDVKLHIGAPEVDAIDAGAAAIGKQVFFAPGQNPLAEDGKALLMHELAHVVHASPGKPEGDLTLGGTDTSAESEAEEVADAVEAGEPIPEMAPGAAGSDGNTIRRGEAGVHQNDITMPGMGVNSPHMNAPDNPNGGKEDAKLSGFTHRDSKNLSPEQRAAMQVYAGNFMSDFSQANVPKALDMLSNVPTMKGGKMQTVGAQGAGIMLQSLVRAFAILELGTEAAALITAQTTEMYEAERHIDNPMGTSASDYVVANVNGTAQDVAQTPQSLLDKPATAIQTVDPTPAPNASKGAENKASGSWHEKKNPGAIVNSLQQAPIAEPKTKAEKEAKKGQVEAATVATHQGSAVPGMQFDNPTLFQVSDAGLSNHIYNSIEASKQSYLKAAQAGPTPIGRMHCGYADHIVQDYFSHSNYIEVSLNKYIGEALDARKKGGATPAPAADHDHDHDHEHDHDHDHEEHEEEGEEHGHSAPKSTAKPPGGASHGDHGHGGGPKNKNEFLDRMEAQKGPNDGLVSPHFVATMYDAQAPGPTIGANGKEEAPRDAITTGSFGASDTMISLAHIFVPMLPKLHESMERSIESFLGVVESAPPGADWPLVADMLTSSGRDGAVLHTLLQGFSDAGVGVSVPSGVAFDWSSVAVSPGWFGDPWTVEVPSGLNLTYSDVPLAAAVGLFCGAAAKVNDLKKDLQKYAKYIGLTSVANAIDKVWTAAKEKFKAALKGAMQKVVIGILQKVTEELNGTKMTPAEAAKFASGGIENALSLANEGMHGAEERTSIGYRLKSGDLQQGSQANTAIGSGDMNGDGKTDFLEQQSLNSANKAADADGNGVATEEEKAAWVVAQKLELEKRVGPVKGSGTHEDPWVPLAPLPPSHSEIAKDHPPHAPGHHEHEHQEQDANPEILHKDSGGVKILPKDKPKPKVKAKDDHAHDHDHGHEHEGEEEDGGAGGHDHEHGSSFFGLGVALAVEAQRHMYKQMEKVWQQTTGDETRSFADHTDASGKVLGSGAAASEKRDKGMEVSHDQTLKEAREQSAREKERNEKRGFRRMEDNASTKAMVGQAPAFQDMAALVDLYISHPNDSNWWKKVVDNYVSAHPDEVYEHILRRNKMAASKHR